MPETHVSTNPNLVVTSPTECFCKKTGKPCQEFFGATLRYTSEGPKITDIVVRGSCDNCSK